jgi:hypothetical protein
VTSRNLDPASKASKLKGPKSRLPPIKAGQQTVQLALEASARSLDESRSGFVSALATFSPERNDELRTWLERRIREVRQATLADTQRGFDLGLAHSLVYLLNTGDTSSFDWVPPAQSGFAREAGRQDLRFPPMPPPNPPVDDTKFDQLDAVGLLTTFDMPRLLNDLRKPRPRATTAALGQGLSRFLTDHLSVLQIVTFWTVNPKLEVEEVSIPRLDTVERCIAYVLGMMLLNRHGLLYGMKRCVLTEPLIDAKTINPRTGKPRVIGTLPHFFLDLPNSKRQFCCVQHAATHRKRQERYYAKFPKAKARAAKRRAAHKNERDEK